MDGLDASVVRHRDALGRTARWTKGEHHYDDVVQEAWVTAKRFEDAQGSAVDSLDRTFLKTLLSHLFQKLVRYTETRVRQAIRLDQVSNAANEFGEAHDLMNRLVGEDGRDPLWYLQAAEEVSGTTIRCGQAHALAGAYVVLLNQLNNYMHALARHLLMSVSHAYRWPRPGAAACGVPTAAGALMGCCRFQAGSVASRAYRQSMPLAFDFADGLPFGSDKAPA